MSAARSATFSEAPAIAQLRDGPVRFTLRRSTRARTIRVVLHPDARGIVVTVPGSRIGEVEAERRAVAFLRDREPWLRRHLRTQAATRARIAARGGARDGGVVPYLGRLHRVRVVPAVVGQLRSSVHAFDGEEGRPDELVIHRADRDRRPDATVLEAWFRERATEAIATAIDRHLVALAVPRPVFALRDPRLLDPVREFAGDATVVMQTLWPNLIVQQQSNTLAMRQIVPLDAGHFDLAWTFFGYADDTPEMQQAYDLFRRRAVATGELFAPFTLTLNPDRTVAVIDFAIAGNGDNAASVDALKTLRDTVIPPIAAGLPDTEVAVTGVTAGTYDFNRQMRSRLPYVFMFVLGLAFVLLLLTFRSLVIAAKAIALNLLSVGAAYGILVAVFQHGWLAGVLGFQTNGAIVSWLPLFLFVVLFGLSMDYHVFILSRVKELHDGGRSTEDAVRLAITRTAGTVTSAALIMVAVFALFASLSLIMMQQMGFGLAVAVLIDATVVRAVLLPAAMKVLGEWNWYLPSWLEWLPSLSPEGEQRYGPQAPRPTRHPGHA